MQLAAVMPRACAATVRVPSTLAAPNARMRSIRHLCRAENSTSSTDASQPQPAAAAPPQPEQQQQLEQPEQPAAPLLAKGQGTAIVTGAISVIFGVAYLVLVQLLDMRGGELQPPPPEAFIP